MDYKKEYEKWLESSVLDEASKEELLNIKDDEEEKEYRFSTLMDFGTAGLRGIMGAGINMMNVYTIKHTTYSLGKVILDLGDDAKSKGVVISFDPRNHSREFALTAALILCALGIRTYLFDDIRPTPELSFAIRELKAISGINITASHNTKEYNGYKVYWEDGAQMPPDMADKVHENMKDTDVLSDIDTMDKDIALNKGLLNIIGENIDNAYVERVLNESEYKKYTKKYCDDFIPALTIENYAQVLNAVIAQLGGNAPAIEQLKAQLDSYNAFYTGLQSYTAGVGSAKQGADNLAAGAAQLRDGTGALSTGAGSLYDGILELKNGIPALSDGVSQLRDGAMQLNDGLNELNEKGIQKLIDAVNGDVSSLAARLRATADVSKEYKSFSGLAEGTDGSVKFIYRTESIG